MQVESLRQCRARVLATSYLLGAAAADMAPKAGKAKPKAKGDRKKKEEKGAERNCMQSVGSLLIISIV